MRRITLLILPLAVSGAAMLGLGAAVSAPDPCPTGDGTSTSTAEHDSSTSSAAASGSGVATVSGDEVVTYDSSAESDETTHSGTEAGVLRHPSSSAGRGTVYVNDIGGRDVVTAVRSDGVAELSRPADASHPAWLGTGEVVFAEGFSSLRAWSPQTGSVRTIDRPAGTSAVFHPVPADEADVIAVAQEPVDGAPPGDDGLNNLYRFHAATGTWIRMTGFSATADQWSVIRTPVVEADGGVLFVLVQGVGSQTADPTFELWKHRNGLTWKVKSLPGEMYLVGRVDAGFLWNIERDGEWRVFLEESGQLREVGCGGGMVDARAEPDPDIVDEEQPASEDPAGGPEPQVASADTGIVVGDFGSLTEARRAYAELSSYERRIVTHADAPFAVGPDAYAVAIPLRPGEDVEAALATLRSQYPQYAETSWIVSLAGGGSGEE